MAHMKALEINHLTKTYHNGVKAVRDISFTIDKGDFFALLGPNGAGKSTTIGIVTSLVNKTSGNIKVFGYDLDTHLYLAKSKIGLVPQEFNFNVFEKVTQILVKQAGFYGITHQKALPRIEKHLKALGLWGKRDQRARFLSGGQKRRLMIARALVHEPELLILDEPTAGVDIELRRLMWEFMEQLNQNGTTIILTTHYLEEAESLCKNIAIIDEGKLIEYGSMNALLSRLKRQTFILDLDTRLTHAPVVDSFATRLKSDYSIEIDIKEDQSLNKAFESLSKQGIQVLSMKNKANRLEEMFLTMTSKKGHMED